VADNPRIEDLRRRVQQDPASIAFAQLGEEHRRAGDYHEAVRVCRDGLDQHPTYLSARVTLGRALMELGEYDQAQVEFEQVLVAAPDNLIAVRSMAELHQRRSEAPVETEPAPAEPEVPDLALRADDDALVDAPVMSLDAAVAEFNTVFGVADAPPADPVLDELEAWLAAILADRAERGPTSGSTRRTSTS
jgi:tetratricopeptide (TPR) repeat protein